LISIYHIGEFWTSSTVKVLDLSTAVEKVVD